MTATMAGSLMTGCGTSQEASATEASTTEASEAGDPSATEVSTEETAAASTEEAGDVDTEQAPEGNTEDGSTLEAQTDPSKDEDDENTGDALAPFIYVGNSVEGRLCTEQALLYGENGYDEMVGVSTVVIPAYVIAEVNEDGSDVEVLANIMVYRFELDGTTLVCTAGGSYPSRIHATGGEITSVETSYTDMDTLALCDGHESLVRVLEDPEALENSLRNNIGMYVNNYGYNIDSYQIGNEPVSINHQ